MRIGALAATAGVTTKGIRFYEQAGLLPAPPRTAAGYRDYPPDTTSRLAFIRAAQAAGLSLAEIREILAIRDHGQPPCSHVITLLRNHLSQTEQRLAELTAARRMLSGLLTIASGADPSACTGTVCVILDPDSAGPASDREPQPGSLQPGADRTRGAGRFLGEDLGAQRDAPGADVHNRPADQPQTRRARDPGSRASAPSRCSVPTYPQPPRRARDS